MALILCVIVLSLLPALLMWGERHVPLIRWLTPIFFCYALGVVWGNLPGLAPGHMELEWVQRITVPLAIPLLLFPTDLSSLARMAPRALLSFGLWTLALAVVASLAAHGFDVQLAQAPQLAGMALGVYTGGTPNLAAVHRALEVDVQTFVEANFTDLMLSGTYLTGLLTFVPGIYRRMLPFHEAERLSREASSRQATGYGSLDILRSLGVALLGVGAVVGLCLGTLAKLHEPFIILGVTALGLLGAAVPRIRRQAASYDTGQYLMMVFCVAVGAMVDLQAFLQHASLMIAFMGSIFLGALLLHFLLARIFRIDADLALMTTVAGIFGPPFVGPVANRLNDRSVIATGMSLGVLGLALGNVLGIGLHWLLAGSG